MPFIFKNKQMKQIVLSFFLLIVLGVNAQELNKVITDPDIHREILIGWVDRAGVDSQDFLAYGKQKYEAYSPDMGAISELKKDFAKDADLHMLVVFGTWCGDSKAYVPQFFKVADLARLTKVKYLAVNRRKDAGNIDMSKLNIERVPTFIVYKGDKEIGRIIETPTQSIENDLVKILKN